MMKKLVCLVFIICIFIGGCGLSQADWQNFSRALQQYDEPETIVSPGGPPVKLESWRYSQPETIFQPRTIVIPGQRQGNSTYWQEKNAEDEWWQRHSGIPK